MFEFLTAEGNLPFSIALLVMLLIAVLEGVSTLLGAGLSELLDTLVPGADVDIDAPDLDSSGSLSRLLGWLRFGQVPVLMLLVIFLTAFGLIGLMMQSAMMSAFGSMLPAAIAWLPATLAALPLVRTLGGALAHIMPKDETDAVSEQSFIGRVAVITLGNASHGSPAEAKLKDQHGQMHYVMVEPDLPNEAFSQGTAVILVRQKGAHFTAINNTSNVLIDN
ncbi:MAG TPA: YqiJ family protein [Gammaproteobacteria bacterium]|jgi:hypothetical protein